MDPEGRRRAGTAVEEARNAANMTRGDLADQAGVSIDTIRDLVSGKRWPWPGSRQRIEQALHWPPGRLTQIATGDTTPHAQPDADSGDMQLDLTALTPTNRYKVLAYYHERLEEQDSGQAV